MTVKCLKVLCTFLWSCVNKGKFTVSFSFGLGEQIYLTPALVSGTIHSLKSCMHLAFPNHITFSTESTTTTRNTTIIAGLEQCECKQQGQRNQQRRHKTKNLVFIALKYLNLIMVLFTPQTVKMFGDRIVTKKAGVILDDRSFIAFYGTTPEIISECWERVQSGIAPGKLKHLLWAFMFMKLYLPEDVMCILVGTSKPTFRKWVWKIIECLALESIEVIDWNKRKRNFPEDGLCSISVDGTDFKTQEPYPFNRKWMSHKNKGAGLKYEVAISIYSGDIVWIYGPHRGSKHDLSIFRENLMNRLEEGEMVEADKGYEGDVGYTSKSISPMAIGV